MTGGHFISLGSWQLCFYNWNLKHGWKGCVSVCVFEGVEKKGGHFNSIHRWPEGGQLGNSPVSLYVSPYLLSTYLTIYIYISTYIYIYVYLMHAHPSIHPAPLEDVFVCSYLIPHHDLSLSLYLYLSPARSLSCCFLCYVIDSSYSCGIPLCSSCRSIT